MKYILTCILLIVYSFSSNQEKEDIKIDIKLKNSTRTFNNYYFLEIESFFFNNSKKKITLPNTFDLKIILTDSSGINVNRKSKVFEYRNLITLNKKEKIKPNEKLQIDFIESRLFFYDLIPNNKYFIQYVLIPEHYPILHKSVKQKIITSNKIEFYLK